jgi:class 3 adenylate cyclase/tetratricopeptide (TPR) repeat protein
MHDLSSFIPIDRRHALVEGRELTDRTTGAAVLADLSGYSALTSALAAALGPQRAAEELTERLHPVFDALATTVHHYGGSILGFAGDALTAWFDDGSPPGAATGPGHGAHRAVTCGLALQQVMAAAPPVPVPGRDPVVLAIKAAIVSGPARRFVVGDPAIQRLDVLAGAMIASLGTIEEHADRGDVLIDEATAAAVAGAAPEGTWRQFDAAAERVLAVTALGQLAAPAPWPALAPGALSEDQVRPWLLPAVWRRLRDNQAEFATELRPAVALMVRFSGLDYTQDQAGARLDTYVRWVQGVLAAYDGALLQWTMGDKGSYFYAAFGAPISHPDQAIRATASALALRTPPPSCPEITGLQIGLANGPVYAGPYGGRDSRTYGAPGEGVILAARLMQATAVGGVLAASAVYRATGDRFAWTALPPMLLKGRTAPVPVYRLEGLRDAADSATGSTANPLIGRRAELTIIDAALAAARAGAGRLLGIVGEAGLGKSRLVGAMVARAAPRGFRSFVGAAQSYGTRSPYLAWQPIVGALLDIPAGLPAESLLPALEARVGALDPALLLRLPLARALLGVNLPDTDLTAGMDSQLRKTALESWLIEYLRARVRAAPDQPCLIVLEDAHWLDPLSADLQAALAPAVNRLPICLVVVTREPDEVSPRLRGLGHYHQIHLLPLPVADAAALIAVRTSISTTELPEQVVANLTERAAGNPFYLEELVTYMLERGGDLRNPAVVAQLQWPASLQSLLLARLDQLAESQRLVLKVASVIGRSFEVPQLWGVHPELGPAAQVAADLTVLAQMGITTPDTAELSYLFKHIVTQEVTYSSLSHGLRARLHEHFAAWLEDTAAQEGHPVSLGLIAYHYGQGSNTAKQREYYRKAGDAAVATWANSVAEDYYRRLLPLLPAAEHAYVQLALGDVLVRLGRWDEATACYRTVLLPNGPTAPDLPITPDLVPEEAGLEAAEAAQGMGIVRRNQGSYAEAIDWLARARTGFSAADDSRRAGTVLNELGRIYELQGAYDSARAVLTEGLALAREHDYELGIAAALSHLGHVAWRQGHLDEARALYGESLERYERLGQQTAISQALTNLGNVAYYAEDLTAAQDFWEQSLALARQLGARQGIAVLLNNLGTVAEQQGDLATATARYTESLALARDLGSRMSEAMTLQNLGSVAEQQNDLAEAATRYRESVVLRQAIGARQQLCEGLVRIAGLAARVGELDRAAELLGALAVLLESSGAALAGMERTVYEQTTAAVEAGLDPAAAAAARARGAALSEDAVVALALGQPCAV